MKIELKNISFNERLSEETNAFAADIYIDGVKAGYAKNAGHGGSTDYSFYPDKDGGFVKNKKLIADAEIYAKSLPPHEYEGFHGEKCTMESDLEMMIDNLLEEYLKEKDKKKFAKKYDKAIIWGQPNGKQYLEVKFKVPLASIPKERLQQYVDKYKLELKPGEVFWNTNFEKLGIKV